MRVNIVTNYVVNIHCETVINIVLDKTYRCFHSFQILYHPLCSFCLEPASFSFKSFLSTAPFQAVERMKKDLKMVVISKGLVKTIFSYEFYNKH